MKIKVGISTIIGYSLLASGLLPVILKIVQEGSVALNGPEAAFALAGVILGGITSLGRYAQAHAALRGPGSPEAEAELARLSEEARANAALAAPEGDDSVHTGK